MKFPRLSRKTWILLGLAVVLVVVLFSTRTREGLENSGFKVVSATYGEGCPGVQGGNVTARLASEIDGKRAFSQQLPQIPGGILNRMFGDLSPGCFKKLEIRYTCNGGPEQVWTGDENSTVIELTPCTEAPPTTPASVPAPSTTPAPSTPPSSATYSASCSKCSVINNQITCACDVLPK